MRDEEEDEGLNVERRLGKLEGWVKGHQAVCDLRFLIFCAVVTVVGGVLTMVSQFGLSSLQNAQHEQLQLLQQLLHR